MDLLPKKIGAARCSLKPAVFTEQLTFYRDALTQAINGYVVSTIYPNPVLSAMLLSSISCYLPKGKFTISPPT